MSPTTLDRALYGSDYHIWRELVALSDHYGNVIMPQARIAEAVRYSVATVQRVLKRLARAGLLQVFGRLGGGRGGCNRYKIVLVARSAYNERASGATPASLAQKGIATYGQYNAA